LAILAGLTAILPGENDMKRREEIFVTGYVQCSYSRRNIPLFDAASAEMQKMKL